MVKPTKKEIQNLKNAIPELRVHELLTQFSSDLSTADSLNDILFSLTDWLNLLGKKLDQLI